MYVEQLYTGCLAEAAYYLESNGEAAIIDPLRETAPYKEMAEKRGATIKYVLETHFHADFVSGHIDLAKETGATIVYGPNANPNYEVHVAKDGEKLRLGDVEIEVLHTPGHTMESSCYLLYDENGQKHSVFTGDTLFIGDVGRPDLAVKTDLTQGDLARHLFDSLHNKLMPLPDEVLVYPGHGAGSACGKNMSKETISTIGQQKLFNYALQAETKEQFVNEVTEGLTTPPAYFPENAKMNQGGYGSFEEVMKQNMKPLSVDEFLNEHQKGAMILDTRNPSVFEQGFVPGSLNIGLDGQYAPWVGSLIPFGERLVLVIEPGNEEEAIRRLARVGYDNVAGYLDGGVQAWKDSGRQLQIVEGVEAEQVKEEVDQGARVLDVRNPAEFDVAHVEGATNIPLKAIGLTDDEQLDKTKPYLVHCAGGYRSMIASSILKAHGFNNFKNVYGGFKAMQEAGNLPIAIPEEA